MIARRYRKNVNGYTITFSYKSMKYRIHASGKQIATCYNEWDAISYCNNLKRIAA